MIIASRESVANRTIATNEMFSIYPKILNNQTFAVFADLTACA